MKAFIVILAGFVIFITPAKSQVEVMDILIGSTEGSVINYLDSLNGLRPAPGYKIERAITKSGNLQLSTSYSLADQDFYKCLNLVFVFTRIDGMEFCSQQVLSGHPKKAESNLNFVKDNFTLVAPNTWEKPYRPGYKLQATFGLVEAKEEKYYYLNYAAYKR